MVQRIALIALIFLITTGFTRPLLSGSEGREIYYFEPISMPDGLVFASQSGTVFSVSIGFKSSPFFDENHHNHKLKAEKILDLLSEIRLPDADITVAKIYVTTREVILNVRVEDARAAEKTRSNIIQVLKRSPAVVFAGSSKQLKLQ